MKGTYVLVINLPRRNNIRFGRRFVGFFSEGYYLYVGSGLRNLEARIQRHLSDDKKRFWHIDFLLDYGKVVAVYFKESSNRQECDIAKVFAEMFTSVPQFGCSDCKCKSHLFSGDFSEIIQEVEKLNLNQYIIEAKG